MMGITQQLGRMLGPELGSLVQLAAAALAGLAIHAVAFRLLRRVSKRTRNHLDDALAAHLLAPSRLLFPLLCLNLIAPALRLSPALLGVVRHGISLALIAAVAWGVVRLTAVLGEIVEHRYDLSASDNLMARQVYTQIHVLRRVVVVIVVVLAGAAMLMTFQRARQLGTSILASAGIVGIVVGMAAQQTLKNLIAGVQIAIAQPIRIDDVVIVEGEWGRIEEITFTFVVVRIWDLRRLVLPISYFIEKPFQNWTRGTGEILGTVFLHLDYGVPLAELRAELQRVVEGSELWDKKVCTIQVTNCTDRTMEVRALVSATDASKAWELRCLVRERLIAFVQSQYPDSLPRLRAELSTPGGPNGESGAAPV